MCFFYQRVAVVWTTKALSFLLQVPTQNELEEISATAKYETMKERYPIILDEHRQRKH